MRISRLLPAAFVLATAVPALLPAQVSMQFDGPKFTSGNTVVIVNNPFNGGGSVAVGPYQAHYTAPVSSLFDVFCIDWDRQIARNSIRQVQVLSFADAVNGSLGHNGVDNFTALKRVMGAFENGGTPITNTAAEYFRRLQATAFLSSGFGAAPSTDWDERHEALWSIFNTNAQWPADGLGGSAAAFRTTALGNAYSSTDFSNFSIILDERAWDTVDGGDYQQALITVTAVPEPGTYALVGFGLLSLVGAARRRARNAA